MTNSLQLIYIKYRDHILFRKVDPNQLRPCIRETIGWLIKETKDELYLSHDKSVHQMPFERCESGLILLKSDIVERRVLE